MSGLSYSVAQTPIGSLFLISDEQIIVGAGFSSINALRQRLSDVDKVRPLHKSSELSWLTEMVAAYFDGDVGIFDRAGLKVRQPGSEFSQRAWRAIRKVRAGTMMSYAQLAEQAGSPAAVRAAGSACGRNVIAPLIPCHRIIRSDGTLGNYGYGAEKKSWLLRHEGAID